MKPLNYIFMIIFFIYGCKSKNDDYEIINRTKIISKNNYQIKVSYPEIEGLADIEKMSELNKVLEKFPEHEYYAKNCEQKKIKKDEVTGEYQILLKTDSLLSIEFRTLIQHENLKTDTIYQSVVVNPKQSYKSKNRIVGLEPEQIIPNFNREMIFPYIEEYGVKNKKHINLLAYKTGSNYVYVGGEGEWFGENKITIPLNKLK